MHQGRAVPDNDQITEAFAVAFRDAAGEPVGDFDCQVLRDEAKQVRVQITIYGQIQVPTRHQFFEQCKRADRITIKYGKRRLHFHFENSCEKNSNDYRLLYVAKF